MKKGFTLVELSMVLIVVGLLMGGAFQMMKTMQEKARATEAKNTLAATKEAVLAYAMNIVPNRLPTAAEFTAMRLVGAGNTPITYIVDGPLTLAAQGPCGIQTTLLRTIDPNAVTTPNVGFVLAVAGENMRSQTTRVGNTVTFPQWNTITAGAPYDDLHIQATLGEVQSTIGCEPPSIINPTLYIGKVATPYTVSFSGKGGNGTYTYTQAGALPAGITFTSPTLSGTPTVAGNYPITISIRSNGITTPQPYVLVINP
jgi:prepilin-type N-terminal cleavage/methylation domain-containing protein